MKQLWDLARLRREQDGKGMFKSMSCRLESVVDSFQSVKSSTLGFDLCILACCAKFFIVRAHQVLPRGLSNVELAVLGRGSLPEPTGRLWVHTHSTSITSH